MTRAALGLAASSLLLAACGAPSASSEAARSVSDRTRGVSYVVPPGWKAFDGEIRSPGGSLLTLRVYDLVEADKKFVAGLPYSLTPQLLEWAQFYYIVLGEPVTTKTTVAGLPATEFDYPIRVRPKDPPSKVLYWVVTRKTRLFVIRAAFPPTTLAIDEPALRDVIAGWGFIDMPEPPAGWTKKGSVPYLLSRSWAVVSERLGRARSP